MAGEDRNVAAELHGVWEEAAPAVAEEELPAAANVFEEAAAAAAANDDVHLAAAGDAPCEVVGAAEDAGIPSPIDLPPPFSAFNAFGALQGAGGGTIVRRRIRKPPPIPAPFIDLDQGAAQKLAWLLHVSRFPSSDVGEICEMPDGTLRLQLDNMPKAPQDPDGFLLHGFHATSVEGAVGILADRRIRAGRDWGVIFFQAKRSTRSTADLVDLFKKARSSNFNQSDCVFEFSLKQKYERLDGGGHEQEVAACQRSGACHYACSDLKRRRWTAREDVVQLEAMWVTPGAKLLPGIDQAVCFRMPGL